jgi:hypothetical protein
VHPLLRQVATAFPHAQVELWTMDEHRIGLKPILKKVWVLPDLPGRPDERWGQPPRRPLAPVEHRYEWRYLVAFVHPASGRTVFHLASTVSIELFSVELAEFARARACPLAPSAAVLAGTAASRAPVAAD